MGMLDKMRGPSGAATDPVCGMKVDVARPPGGLTEHGGTTYYFCSAGCKRKFDADPHKFLGAHEHGHHGMQ
jgi:Cu+-exporting ATPase